MLHCLTDSRMWAFSPREKPLRPVTFSLWADLLQQALVVVGPAGLQGWRPSETQSEGEKERTVKRRTASCCHDPPGNTFSHRLREWVSLATGWAESQLLGMVKCDHLWGTFSPFIFRNTEDRNLSMIQTCCALCDLKVIPDKQSWSTWLTGGCSCCTVQGV